MVGPCRRDPTALVEQESKGGASETVGSSEMPGRPMGLQQSALSPPCSASLAQWKGRAALWTPALTNLFHRKSQPVLSKTATSVCER